MSAANLLNLNVDTLFEQHSVAEIDIVQKKIQAEVEKKREELRTMVGERYRDLLQAADTIATMRESSESLISQVESIMTNCKSLNEKQLIGFKNTDSDASTMVKSRSANKQLNNYFSTMVQIKVLTSLPEMIWSHIDGERFFIATELFIFSRHISTGLQLDVNNKIMQFLPVAKKQWEILKPFHVTIKQNVLSVLERKHLSADTATDCLLSLLLLEKSNLNDILKLFLQLRCTAYLKSLTEEEKDETQRVKDRILESLKLLFSTVVLFWECFIDSDNVNYNSGLISKRLEEHSDANALPTISLLDGNDAQFSYMLPEIINNFSPKFDSQNLDEQTIRYSLEEWIAEIARLSSIHLKNLFELVLSMNVIQEIKKASLDFEKNANFTMISKKFQLSKSLNFYEWQYTPLINQRVRDIIRQSWEKCLQTLLSEVEWTLNNISSYKTAYSTQLWIDDCDDLPLSLKEILTENQKMKKLLMKIKGFSPKIIEICTNFDRELEKIVSEMSGLIEDQKTPNEEKIALTDFLRDISQQQITELITHIKGLNAIKDREQLLYIVRILPALIELCPNLKICMYPRSNWRQSISNTSERNLTDNWIRVCSLIEDETLIFWKRLINIILSDTPIEKFMPIEIGLNTILQEFANWENVTLEQKDDQDNPVHSTFRIPCQPRISLQDYLFTVIRSLKNLVPQTLPQKVHVAFNNELITQLLQHYKSLIAHKFTAISQNMALQLYFDLKFLQAMFTTREDRSLTDDFQAEFRNLKGLIDPFDFELFSEQITANVKRAVSKMYCQLGVIGLDATKTTAAPLSISQDKEHNVLSLSSNGSQSIWFPLLPIVAPTTSISPRTEIKNKTITAPEVEKPPIVRTPSRRNDSSKSQNVTSNVKSGAAAFFGAMSQDWFR